MGSLATFMTIVMLSLLSQGDPTSAGAMFLIAFPVCSASFGYLTVLVTRKAADDKEQRQHYEKVLQENDVLWEQHDHFYSNNFMLPQTDRLR